MRKKQEVKPYGSKLLIEEEIIMKKIIVETKHGGSVSIPIFETLEDAVKVNSKDAVLRNFNRMVRIDIVNEANRKMSLTARLKKAVKDGKLTVEDLEKLLK
jgi:hypothetical protein